MKISNNYKSLLTFILSSVLIISFLNINDQLLTKNNSFLKWKIKQEKKEAPKFGYPGEAQQFFYEQRAYPLGHIPEGWKSSALSHIKQNNINLAKVSNAATLSWTELGPDNIGGRVRDILINPKNSNIIYVAAVSGGVWKSTDGGDTWHPLKDKMKNLAVCSLAMNPNNPDTIWAGTGEGFYNYDAIRGAGIFKSTDGGATWNQLSSTADSLFYFVNKLVFDKTTNTLWAATKRGFFSSADGGKTFKTRLSAKGYGMDIEIADTKPTTIYVSFGLFNQSQIWRSTDGGKTFSQIYVSSKNRGRIEMAISPSDTNNLYIASLDLKTNGVSYIGYSHNKGISFDSLKVPGPSYSENSNYAGKQAWYDNVLSINPKNPDEIFAAGISLWKTTDAGTAWAQISNWYKGTPYPYIHADFHVVKFDPNNSSILYVGTDGGIFKSTDGGKYWQPKNYGLNITQFYYGAVDPSKNIYYGGSQDNGTLRSQSGQNWYVILGGDGGAVEVNYLHPNIIYAEYVNLQLYKSTDYGSSFNKATTGIPVGKAFWSGTTDRTLFISPYSIDPTNPDNLVAGTYRIWKTTNSASSWTAISGDLTGDGTGKYGAKISTVIVARGDLKTIYAGISNGTIQTTTDNGKTWTQGTGTPNLFCTRIASAYNNAGTAYATYSGFSPGEKVFKTTDYGKTWVNISGNLPNIPANSIVVSPADTNTLIVGTDLGVFVTTDGGTHWTQHDTGLPNVVVMDLDYRSSDKKLFAATHGRGMFSAPISGITEVKTDNNIIAKNFMLAQNYPNPFNPSTIIKYNLPKAGTTTLKIYDILGNEVATLVNGFQKAGSHSITFSASNFKLASGIYIYRLQSNGYSASKKMMLLK